MTCKIDCSKQVSGVCSNYCIKEIVLFCCLVEIVFSSFLLTIQINLKKSNPKHKTHTLYHMEDNRCIRPWQNNRNMPKQPIATCWVRLATVLRCVAICWLLLAQIWKWSNLSQQHPTCHNTVAKRMQHVAPNNVVIVWLGLKIYQQSFKRAID